MAFFSKRTVRLQIKSKNQIKNKQKLLFINSLETTFSLFSSPILAFVFSSLPPPSLQNNQVPFLTPHPNRKMEPISEQTPQGMLKYRTVTTLIHHLFYNV